MSRTRVAVNAELVDQVRRLLGTRTNADTVTQALTVLVKASTAVPNSAPPPTGSSQPGWDDVFAVACPTCTAAAESPCVTRNGNSSFIPHVARMKLAHR